MAQRTGKAAPELTEDELHNVAVNFYAQMSHARNGDYQALVAAVLAVGQVVLPPLPVAPVNVDVPFVAQAGDTLSCTMGNWEGEPDTYAYQWQLDGVNVGTDAATHTVTVDDVGRTATCVVTATNPIGATTAPPSNAVVIADPALGAERGARGAHRNPPPPARHEPEHKPG
jgi:hypothetical protein